MLFCQNLRRCHQRSLVAVLDSQIGRRRGYHGLAATHIALYQTVHGRAGCKIVDDLVDRPLLRPGEGEWKCIHKRQKIQILVGDRLFSARDARMRESPAEKTKNSSKISRFFAISASAILAGSWMA